MGSSFFVRSFNCSSRMHACMADAEWYEFGVLEFPDIEAVPKHFKFLEELELFRYGEMKSYLGTQRE